MVSVTYWSAWKLCLLITFSRELPPVYRGFSVNFSQPDPNDHGVRHAVYVSGGRISPLIFPYTETEYLQEYLGYSQPELMTELDWLSLSEHKLLALTCGKFFRDDLGIGEHWKALEYYPESVRLYLIASNWSLAAEEQAFVRRCDLVVLFWDGCSMNGRDAAALCKINGTPCAVAQPPAVPCTWRELRWFPGQVPCRIGKGESCER